MLPTSLYIICIDFVQILCLRSIVHHIMKTAIYITPLLLPTLPFFPESLPSCSTSLMWRCLTYMFHSKLSTYSHLSSALWLITHLNADWGTLKKNLPWLRLRAEQVYGINVTTKKANIATNLTWLLRRITRADFAQRPRTFPVLKYQARNSLLSNRSQIQFESSDLIIALPLLQQWTYPTWRVNILLSRLHGTV